jgi:hypothetical protein
MHYAMRLDCQCDDACRYCAHCANHCDGTWCAHARRDTAAKLDLLYRKNLYPVAISLAYASDYDVPAVMDIYRSVH